MHYAGLLRSKASTAFLLRGSAIIAQNATRGQVTTRTPRSAELHQPRGRERETHLYSLVAVHDETEGGELAGTIADYAILKLIEAILFGAGIDEHERSALDHDSE